MSSAPGVHRREPHSILAAAEGRLLHAIAERLPAFVTSDRLTLLSLASMLLSAAAFAFVPGRPAAAAAVVGALAANWFGDSLDGTLARVRRCERPRYGYYVDHVVDLAGVTALVAGMGASGAMEPLIAAAVLLGYVLVSAEAFLATHAAGTFRLSFAGVGPTELRVLLATAAVWLGFHPASPLLDVGGAIAAGGLAAAFVVCAARNAAALRAQEPLG